MPNQIRCASHNDAPSSRSKATYAVGSTGFTVTASPRSAECCQIDAVWARSRWGLATKMNHVSAMTDPREHEQRNHGNRDQYERDGPPIVHRLDRVVVGALKLPHREARCERGHAGDSDDDEQHHYGALVSRALQAAVMIARPRSASPRTCDSSLRRSGFGGVASYSTRRRRETRTAPTPRPITAIAITTSVVELEPVNARVELGAGSVTDCGTDLVTDALETHTLDAATAAV